MQNPYDFIVIGGGIIGLATAFEVLKRFPQKTLLLLEKEAGLARHQTGRNSGVIHSGVYYQPGSLKAQNCLRGADLLRQFCQKHQLPLENTGKVIVATKPSQQAILDTIYKKGCSNGVSGIEKIDQGHLNEIEPHVRGIEAIWVPSAGIVSYPAVCQKLAEEIQNKGGNIFLGEKVVGLKKHLNHILVSTSQNAFRGRYIFNCSGLYADKISLLAGKKPKIRIVPFRGEYYKLVPKKEYLVKGLIYPVPDPSFPFLGVHFTRMVDGSVEAGPNAVLALRREGYYKTSFSLHESWDTFSYSGFWSLAKKHWSKGTEEMIRSWSKRVFVRSLQELIPEITPQDVVPFKAGVRAQALERSGKLVDDFRIETSPRMLHVINAPSPAATASFAIAQMIVDKVPNFDNW